MKWKWNEMNRKTKICGIIIFAGLLIVAVFLGIYQHLSRSLEDQKAADRWSKDGDAAQISCYFPQNTQMTPDRIYGFRQSLDQYLLQSSIYSDASSADARLWMDAYSAQGTLPVANDNTALTVQCIGVGGDFFLFHPVNLMEGAYFSGQDVMQDYCVIDRETAWKMYGSTNIVGQYLLIGQVPHKIVGVYEMEEQPIYEKAGLSQPIIFVSYDTLSKYGNVSEIQNYEIVMPDPVKNFAFHYVSEQLGDKEGKIEILENSSRFHKSRILSLLADFGSRSMHSKPIVYPYWENVARGYEDYLMIILLFLLLFFSVPMVLTVICVIIAWRSKTWTVKTVIISGKEKVTDGFEHIKERNRINKEKRKAERSWEDEEF